MKFALYMLTVLWALPFAVQAQDQPKSSREYDIKAAFLYNFVVFTEWPKDVLPDGNEPIVIAIIGHDPFGNAFDPVKDQLVKGRKVQTRRFKGIEELTASGQADLDKTKEAIRKCHLLFVCRSEEKAMADIIAMVKGASVLTVADTPGFLESGGMINLIVEETKIRFEINNTAANEVRLKVGSQLLRMAKRVIGEKTSEAAGKQ